MTILSGIYFSSTALDCVGKSTSPLYQRNVVNQINATADDAIDIGTLTTNKTQLDVGGQVNRANPKNYYKFTLDGDSMKMDFTNLTGSADMRVKITDSSGNVIADNEGTDDQIAAFDTLSSSDGLDADPGEYTITVSYGSTALKGTAQNYSIGLYSGTEFTSSYQTLASSQTSLNQKVVVDNTLTYATSDAEDYSVDAYNHLNASATDSVDIGWLYENKTALKLSSTLTTTNYEQYYSFTVQKGETVKMSLNNITDTSDLRVQIMDATGTYVFADSQGTEEQQAAYAELTSSDGLALENGVQYTIKVSYADGADRTDSQKFQLSLYSGDHYTDLYETNAYPESYDTASLNGTLPDSYSPLSALASQLYSQAQGEDTDIFTTLASLV